MAKLLGIREVVGATGLLTRDVQGFGLPAFMRRAQNVSLMNYERDNRSLGQEPSKLPYDLNVPGRVAEIKRVLIALGHQASDIIAHPADPQIEDTFKHIDVSPEYLDAWDGPTADAFALTVGRHKHRFPALMPLFHRTPMIQLQVIIDKNGRETLVGGPQPTVAGLEALAQAAHEVLKDSIQLDQYLAWRGGVLDCISGVLSCVPPESTVTQSNKLGRPWNPRGYTVAWVDGPVAQSNPNLLAQLALVDQSLVTSWLFAPQEINETARVARAKALIDSRKERHDIVQQLNVGAAPPACDEGMIWSPSDGQCVDRCRNFPGTKWDPVTNACAIHIAGAELPYDDFNSCVTSHIEAGYDADYANRQCTLEYPGRGVFAAVTVGAFALMGFGAVWLVNRARKGGFV